MVKLLDEAPTPGHRLAWSFLAGASLWWPFFFKQTFGLAWLLPLTLGIILWSASGRIGSARWALWLGYLSAALSFFGWLFLNGALKAWVDWSILYPLSIRNSSYLDLISQVKSSERMLLLLMGIVGSAILSRRVIGRPGKTIIYMTPLAFPAVVFALEVLGRVIAGGMPISISLIAGVWTELLPLTLVSLLLFMLLPALGRPYVDPWDVVQIGLVVALMSGWLSQGFVGSSHATWPLIVLGILIAVSKIVGPADRSRSGKYIAVGLVSVCLFSIGVVSSTLALSRYSWLAPQGEARTIPGLAWASTPGDAGADTADAVILFEEFSAQGPTAVFPGEEPVSFITGAIPAGEVSASDGTTNPEFYALSEWFRGTGAQFLIVRSDGQSPMMAGVLPERVADLTQGLNFVKKRGKFAVYERP